MNAQFVDLGVHHRPKMAMQSKSAAGDLVERLARFQDRLAAEGRHREAGIVARAIAEEGGGPAPAARRRGDLR